MLKVIIQMTSATNLRIIPIINKINVVMQNIIFITASTNLHCVCEYYYY